MGADIRLLPERVVAEQLGMSVVTLRKYRCSGRGPRFLKLGRTVRYEVADLERWLEQNRVRSTAEHAVIAARRS